VALLRVRLAGVQVGDDPSRGIEAPRLHDLDPRVCPKPDDGAQNLLSRGRGAFRAFVHLPAE